MTTGAFDGCYLAFDQRHISGNSLHYSAPKIVRAPRDHHDGVDVFYASTGPVAWFGAWMRWDAAGADPDACPRHMLEGYQGGLMRCKDGMVEMMDFRIPYWTPVGKRWAWGSGGDFALGAMDWGADAMEAVKVAAGRDPNTGGGVDYLDITTPWKGVRFWGTI